MKPVIIPQLSIMISCIIILIGIYSYLYYIERKKFFGLWLLSWSVNLVGQILRLAIFNGLKNPSMDLLAYILFIISIYLLVMGSFSYLEKKTPLWYSWIVLLVIVWTLFPLFISNVSSLAKMVYSLIIGLSTIWVGVMFLHYGNNKSKLWKIFGGCFILWGIHKIDYFIFSDSWVASWGYIASAFFSLVITITFIIIYFEKIRDELLESKKELGINQRKLFTIIDNQRDMIFELDNTGNFTFLGLNQGFYETIGLSPNDVKEIGFIEFIGLEAWNEIKNCGKEEWCSEKKWVRENNNEVYLKFSCKISYNKRNQLENVFGSISDITEQKLLTEAKEYDRLRTEFFANLSHELRTPLNLILASSQLLQLYSENSIETEYKEKFNKNNRIIKQNVYRLTKLISNLIDITKVDTGFYELILANHNIINVVEDITLSVVDYIESRGVSLIFDTDLEERIISCDSDSIERIMLNLLSNSAKFTDQGGIITVSIRNDEKNVFISVRDTGIGIPVDKLGTVFERFSQVDKSLTRNHEGSGIGLSLVKSLVELHGGYIKVNSILGEGSEFTIALPVNIVEEHEAVDSYANCCDRKKQIEFSDLY